MGWRWCRSRELGVGLCLLVLTGCLPVKQGAKGIHDQEAAPISKSEVKAVDGGKPAQASKATETSWQQTAPPPSSQASAPTPEGYRMRGDDPTVAERISLYRQKKGEWDKAASQLASPGAGMALPESWPECQQDLEVALAGYQRLQAGLERGLDPWEVVGRDLQFFAKGCDRVLARVQSQGVISQEVSAVAALDSGIDQIRQYFEAGQYPEVVTAYAEISRGQERSQIPREGKILCSRALVKLGRFQEATAILTELLRETGPSTDLASLEVRMLAGDALLADGQVEEARQVYEGLTKALAPFVSQQEWAVAHAQAFAEQVSSDDLELYRNLLQEYLRFNGQGVPQALVDDVAKLQGRGAGPFSDLARMILNKATTQAQSWVRNQLTTIRGLVEAHDLGRARQLLDQVSATAAEEMRPAIAQLEREIAQAETAAVEGTETKDGDEKVASWEDALHLFEQQKYDESIAGFQKFLNSERSTEAQVKIAEATELAAAAMRRQAASLYAKARKTFDPEAKRQILQSSQTLLLGLIEKYPTASLVDKARQNLKVLEIELGQATATTPPGGTL